MKHRISQYAGPSSTEVKIGPLTIWYSYSTPVAFQIDGQPLRIARNNWGPTTGKHLNAIDRDHGKRIPHDDLLLGLDVPLTELCDSATWKAYLENEE